MSYEFVYHVVGISKFFVISSSPYLFVQFMAAIFLQVDQKIVVKQGNG